MWFATDDGFNRFDGYSFVTFKFDASDSSQFHDNFVQSIFSDSNGMLWVSSRKGFYRFNLSNQQLTPFLHQASNNDVSFISEGSAGNLWIAWYWSGFGSFDKKTEKITVFSDKELPSLTSTASIAVLEDTYGYLWIGSQDKGLNVFKVNGSNPVGRDDALSANDALPSLYVKCMSEDHLGNIWIGTTRGLVVYLRKENRFHVFSDDPAIGNKSIFSLLLDTDRNLWIGTQGKGLYRVPLKDFDGRKMETLAFEHIEVLDVYNISQHTIRSLFEDRDKNLWVGTHGDGIFMIGREDRRFLKVQAKRLLKSAETYVSFFGLAFDQDGYVWAGTDGEGIYKLDVNGTILQHYTTGSKKGRLTSNHVLTAYCDIDDNLWFGTYSEGLVLFDRKTQSFKPFHHDSRLPLAEQVRLIFQDSRKNIWIGATRGGLSRADLEKGYIYTDKAADLKSADVRAIVEDKQGGLWIGCYGNGLRYHNPVTNESRIIFEGTGYSNPLKSNVIYALALDNKNRLWIGTAGGGLSIYNIVDKSFARYTDADGLLNNTIYGIAIDDDGNVWTSTIKGISKFDPEKNRFFNYTSVDGVQEGQFNPGSVLTNVQKGYICFGGTMGLNIFNPSSIKDESSPPVVMISGFQLFNKPVKIGKSNGDEFALEKVVDEVDEIILGPDETVFTFEFTALNYNFPKKTSYLYQLEGMEDRWNFAGTERSVTYRYLQPGNYVFKVKATSQDGEWPKEFASVKLKVLPPFYRTSWAYASYVLAVGGAFYLAYSIRRRQRYLQRRLMIEKNQRKRERQLVQEKLSFFTEVSHEFRTPLTLMIGPLEEILTREGTVTPAGKKLRMVYKNAFKLLHLINKLLDYRKVETGNLVLRVKEDDIVHFVEEIYITFKEMAIRKKIKFEFTTDVPSIRTWFDKEKMEMAINNILSNSFKYIGNGNSIKIHVKSQVEGDEPAKVVIEIRDDGIGIKKQDLKYIFDWFYHGHSKHPLSSGIGLALAKKLIYLHKGQILVNSAEGKGSVFTIKVPIGKEHFNPDEIVFDEQNDNVLQVPNPVIVGEDLDEGTVRKKGWKSILVVEDDDEVRSFLVKYFEQEFRTFEATNGKEGLAVAMEHGPDLIISDVMMPEMNGVDLCKQIKNNLNTSHIPVILLTAKTAFSHQREGLEIGADYYITKPFSPEVLSLTIHNLLQSRENLKRFYRNRFINHSEEKAEINSPDEHLLQRIYEVLKKNLANPKFNLDDVSDELGMSRSLLYKKIKTLTGLSPVEYVRSIKLAEAAMLLKTKRYKVFEVVYMVGFSDLKYFRECFFKQYGYAPSQLLEKNEAI
jgi:ligand-binding sensor domain-containing protein/signal transduction histidine kinase/DNA-binding response OmpR family regulator